MSKFNKTKEWLIEEYVIKNRSRKEVAQECGLTIAGLKSVLLKLGIKKEKTVIDDDEITRLVKEGKYVDDLAKIYKCSESTIYRKLQKLNLKIIAEPRLKEQYDSTLDSKIIKMYCDNKMSSTQIGEILGVSHTYILTHLKRNNINRRNLSASLFAYNGKDYPLELLDKDTMIDLYENMRKSKKEISDMLNCSPDVIDRVLKNYNIQIRGTGEAHIGLLTGEDHPNWKGGVTNLHRRLREYFYVQQVPKILERDNYTCQLCGKHRPLHVHHIKHFSNILHKIESEHPELDPITNINDLYNIAVKDPELNDLNNLITYCADCHRYEIHKYKRNINQADKKSTELLEKQEIVDQQPSLQKV